jgi:hypothetical protein
VSSSSPVEQDRGASPSCKEEPVDTQVQKAQKIVPVPTLHFSEGALAGRVVRLDRDGQVVAEQRPHQVGHPNRHA